MRTHDDTNGLVGLQLVERNPNCTSCSGELGIVAGESYDRSMLAEKIDRSLMNASEFGPASEGVQSPGEHCRKEFNECNAAEKRTHPL